MLQDQIGKHAGQVWELLKANGGMTQTKIGKELSLSGNDVNRAIGWLAREDKLAFEKGARGTVQITLKD